VGELKDWQKIKALRKRLATLKPEDYALLKESEKKEWRELARAEQLFTYRYDFARFCIEPLKAESWGEPPAKWGKLHYDLCRFIRSCKNRGDNALIQVPRFHLKTQICTIFYRIWRMVHDPELCALIVSGTLELSKGTARAIRAELQNNKELRDLYEHVLPEWIYNDRRNKWSECQFSVARSVNYPQCSTEAVGVDATVTGKHFGEISLDDLVTDKNSTTPEQCHKVIQAYRYFLSVGNPRRQRGQIPLMVVGTPYTDNDLYTFLEEPAILETFRVFKRPVYDELGNPIWPQMYTKAKLLEIAAAQGTYIFSAQYLLNPIPEDQQEFRGAWIQTYRGLPKDIHDQEISLDKYILVDPVTAKPVSSTSKDRGVILVVGRDRAGNWYILDYILYPRAKESETFEGIFKMCEKWNTWKIGWETVAYQVQGKHNLEEEFKRRGQRIVVTPLKPGNRDKDYRIRRLIPYFERGQIFIAYWMIELIHELKRFPHGQTKDILDALQYMVDLIPVRRGNPLNRGIGGPGAPPQKAYYR
jgi:predicted phage terminase large subunit-like protein